MSIYRIAQSIHNGQESIIPEQKSTQMILFRHTILALSLFTLLPAISMHHQRHNTQQPDQQRITVIYYFYYHSLACKTLRFGWQQAVSYNFKHCLLLNKMLYLSQKTDYFQHQKATNENIYTCFQSQSCHNTIIYNAITGFSQHTRAYSPRFIL